MAESTFSTPLPELIVSQVDLVGRDRQHAHDLRGADRDVDLGHVGIVVGRARQEVEDVEPRAIGVERHAARIGPVERHGRAHGAERGIEDDHLLRALAAHVHLGAARAGLVEDHAVGRAAEGKLVGRLHGAASLVEPHHGVGAELGRQVLRALVGDVHRPAAERDGARVVADRVLAGQRVGRGGDLADRVRVRVGHPDGGAVVGDLDGRRVSADLPPRRARSGSTTRPATAATTADRSPESDVHGPPQRLPSRPARRRSRHSDRNAPFRSTAPSN